MQIDISNPAQVLLISILLAAWGYFNIYFTKNKQSSISFIFTLAWILKISAIIGCISEIIMKGIQKCYE